MTFADARTPAITAAVSKGMFNEKTPPILVEPSADAPIVCARATVMWTANDKTGSNIDLSAKKAARRHHCHLLEKTTSSFSYPKFLREHTE
ncbi:hypothetical protein CPB85DRAFT_1440305 [Mucidula mucida]|nr:hypothetical protein CPB85DRAFT_1440305 [Mucidula mucida]